MNKYREALDEKIRDDMLSDARRDRQEISHIANRLQFFLTLESFETLPEYDQLALTRQYELLYQLEVLLDSIIEHAADRRPPF